MTDRLEGKVAFITGAGTGIGRCASELFASEGARIVVAEIDAASGAETEERIRSAGGEALWVETDVTDAGSVRAAIDRAVDRFGRLDVVYNNAGGSTQVDGPVTEAPEDEFWRVIRLDLFGHLSRLQVRDSHGSSSPAAARSSTRRPTSPSWRYVDETAIPRRRAGWRA